MADNLNITVRNSIKNLTNTGSDLFGKVGTLINKSAEEQTVEIIMYIIIALVVLIFIVWAYHISTLNNRDCAKLDKIYANADTRIAPISMETERNKYTASNELFKGNHAVINAYYVKTAYNCCSPGDMKNSFVNICALRKCIQLGARCLDFEIYSTDGKPVVATATVNGELYDSFYIKQTFNSIDLVDVLYTIYYYAFNSDKGGAPNSTDPLFIHMRIMTNEDKTINLIAKYLNEIMADKLLGIEYGNANYGKPMSNNGLIQFSNKCIVMVEQNSLNINTILSSNLYPFINILTNSENCRLIRQSQLSSEDATELLNYNKYYMSMVLPDLSPSSSNFNPANAFQQGCQFVGMHFQNFDTNLEFYFSLFDEMRYSYVLKECSMRHIPVHYLVNSLTKAEKGTLCDRHKTVKTGSTTTTVSMQTGTKLKGLV